MRSFRHKLTFLAAGTSGGLILMFALGVWGFVSRHGKARLDQEIRALGANAIRVGRHHGWHEMPRAQQFLGNELHDVGFAVAPPTGGLTHPSPRWPVDLQGALPLPGASGEAFAVLHAASHSVWRIGAFSDGPHTVYVAVNLERFHAHAAHLAGFFLVALSLTLIAAGGGAWWFAGRALRPIEALTVAAEGITAEQLGRRIASEGADVEVGRLIAVFNAMLQRLERSYQQAVRFSADVSHELKTPLAVMQGEIEAALGKEPEGSPAQCALVSLLEELQRLKDMVHRLLLLSRADAGTLCPRAEPFDLTACVSEIVEDFQALSPTQRFEAEIAPGVMALGDPGLLPLIPRNLLDNATQYNEPDGLVRVTLTREGERAVLRVANSGPPIAHEVRERIFDRFYRADPARGRDAGAGLGLSLACELARAHGGELSLLEAEPTTFELALPLA